MLCRKCNKTIPDESSFCNFCGINQIINKKVKTRGNGLGSVYKRNGKWTAEITLDYITDEKGNKKRKTKTKYGFATKKDALLYLQNLREDTATATIADLYTLFQNGKCQKLSDKRQATYDLAYSRISPIHKLNIGDIKISTLQSIINEHTFYNGRYIKDLLSKLYQLAIPQGYASANLSLYLTLSDVKNSKPTECFSPNEVSILWQAYRKNEPMAAYILVMIYTGMMTSEIINLCPNMIDFDNNLIIGANSHKTKLRESTPIVFPDIIKPVLESLIKNKLIDKPIFGMTDITFCRHFKKFIVQYCLDLNLTPYSARRTTATALALAEVPPAVIAKIMRQTSYDTTLKYYTKIDYADALDALNKLK